MKLNRLSLALLLVTGLQGCSLIPEYHRPEASVQTTWPQGPAYPTGTPVNSMPDWQTFFRDPALRQLIQVSLAHNLDLRKAALNVQAYRAQYDIQRADLLPTVDLGASSSRARVPHDLTTSGKAEIQSQAGVEVGLSSYELDVFGRIRSLNAAALEQYLATDEAQSSVRIGLISNVATAYLTWRTDQALLQVTHDTLDSYTKSLSLIDSSAQAGTASALDVRQARTLVEGARAQMHLYTRQVAQDANGLQLLLGTQLPRSLAATAALDPDLLADVPAGLPSDLLIRRPDIRAAEHRLQAANANIGAARAAFFPSISLTAAAGTTSHHLDGLFDGGSGSWSFSPQINVPIFNGGRLRANLDGAEIEKDINVAQYQQSIQTAFREVADGLAAKGTYDGQMQAQTALVQADQEYYDMARQRYEEGVDNYLTLLDAQRELFGARQQLLTDRLQQLTSQVQLYKALGGGWESGIALVQH